MKLKQNPMADLKVADQKGRILLGSRYAGKRFAMREEKDGTAVLTPVIVVAESESSGIMTSRRLADRFGDFDGIRDNWDGRGSLAPTGGLITYARETVAMLQASALSRDLPWTEPHIGCNELGQITLEWWQCQRSLTLTVRSVDRIDYLKAWGPDIKNEMEDGEVSSIADFIALSHWLHRGLVEQV